MIILFAAMYESGPGTKRTSRSGLAMSVDGLRPEVAAWASNRRD